MYTNNAPHTSALIAALIMAGSLMVGCANTGDLITSGSTAATSASTTAEANDYADARRFEQSRHIALRRDVASGQGEHLDAFAQLMGQQDVEQFAAWMQSRYTQLYPDNARPGELVDRVVALGESQKPIRRVSG